MGLRRLKLLAIVAAATALAIPALAAPTEAQIAVVGIAICAH